MTQAKKSPIEWSETTDYSASAAGIALAEGGYNLLFSVVNSTLGYGACFRAYVSLLNDGLTIDDIGEYAGTDGREISCDHTDLDQAKRDCEAWLETFARSLYNQL